MPFIIRVEIITVNNTNGVVELKTVFEPKSASRVAFQYPFRLHFHPDSCRNLYCFAWFQSKFCRCKEVIAGTSCCRSLRQTDSFIYFLCFFLRLCEGINPVCCKAFFAYFMKFCDSFHLFFLLSGHAKLTLLLRSTLIAEYFVIITD